MEKKKIRVTVWNEYRHERNHDLVAYQNYPNGIHGRIAEILGECDDLEIRTAVLDDPDHGIPDEVLDNTDVLVWWGHMYHGEVSDERVKAVQQRVYMGMGFIACHSAHHSKPFKAIVGTTGNLSWGDDVHEVVWNLKPSHPIAAGIPDHFDLGTEELYAERFDIPNPDDLIFGSWYETGHIFRSGVTFTRGAGKIFYFQPGHENCRSFYNPYVMRILQNAVHWAAPNDFGYEIEDSAPRIYPIV